MPFDLMWRRPFHILLLSNSPTVLIAIPTSFFLDKDGVIQVAQVGAMTKRQIEIRLIKVMK